MMSKAIGLLALLLPTDARPDQERIGCTAVGIDGAASVDGSAFAGMNADSGSADIRLTFVPGKQHQPGAMRPVYTFNLSYPRFVGYGHGELFHPSSPDAPLYQPVGEIPEVPQTFGYYEATQPLMNNQGLGFGESSCAAMLLNRFPDDAKDTRDVPIGILDTVTMMMLALERCATARCGVEVMGDLAEKHGFVPTPGEPSTGSVFQRTAWDDAGEAYTLADKTGEAWVFHVLGGVSGITKSIWAAQKVPKGHIAVIPNEYIIGDLPNEPTNDFLFNKDIFKAAKAAGLWDGNGKLNFRKTFAPNPLHFEAGPAGTIPIPLYGSLRHWGIFHLAAPSLNLEFKASNMDLPFSVKVDKLINHRDVMGYFRTQYEGTEFDLTQGMLAGPFGNPFRPEGGPKTGQIPRGIAIQRTLYGIICQVGPNEQVGWFAHDTPTTAVYIPLHPRVDAISKLFSVGVQAEFSRNAPWAFNFVSNFMQLNYAAMSKDDVYPAIEQWQDTIDKERQNIGDMDDETLYKYQLDLQERVVASWWKLSEFLIMKYNDGKTNYPKVGVSWAYPEWFAETVGFSNDIHPRWARPAIAPPPSIVAKIAGYVAPVFPLPQVWISATSTWSWEPPTYGDGSENLVAIAPQVQGAATVMAMLASMAFGVMVGRSWERRNRVKPDLAAYAPLL